VLPDEIRTLFFQKRHNNVLVIVGSTADEMTSLGGAGNAPKTLQDFRQRLAQQYGDLAPEFETVYKVTSDADIASALMAVGRDTTFSSHMRAWARMTTAAGSDAYLYYFTHTPPHPRAAELKAFHASEIPYVFNVVPSSDPREAGYAYADADRMLADRMPSYWVNFITWQSEREGSARLACLRGRDGAISGTRHDDTCRESPAQTRARLPRTGAQQETVTTEGASPARKSVHPDIK
jgi:para-nitrobenzyl esterase